MIIVSQNKTELINIENVTSIQMKLYNSHKDEYVLVVRTTINEEFYIARRIGRYDANRVMDMFLEAVATGARIFSVPTQEELDIDILEELEDAKDDEI